MALPTDPAYWVNRWSACFPATYPPELYEEVVEERVEKGLFGRKKTRYVRKACCRRCRQPIATGHMCPDVAEILRNEKDLP